MVSNLVTWAALVGVLLPPAVALLQKAKWPPLAQSAVFAAGCVAASFIVAWLDQSSWNWSAWRTTLLTIIGASLALFKLYWKPAGAIDLARASGPIK